MLTFLVLSNQRLLLLFLEQTFMQSTVMDVPPEMTLSVLFTPEANQNSHLILHPPTSSSKHPARDCWCIDSWKIQYLIQRRTRGVSKQKGQKSSPSGNCGTDTERLWSQYFSRTKEHEFKPHINPDFRGLSSGRTLDYMKFVRKVQEIYSNFMDLKSVLNQTKTNQFIKKKNQQNPNLEGIPWILNEKVFKIQV